MICTFSAGKTFSLPMVVQGKAHEYIDKAQTKINHIKKMTRGPTEIQKQVLYDV